MNKFYPFAELGYPSKLQNHSSLEELLLKELKKFDNSYEANFHAKHVAELSFDTAKKLDLDNETSELVYLAGLGHDLGKLKIDRKTIKSPDPTPEEWNTIRQHPILSVEIIEHLLNRLNTNKNYKALLSYTYHHHESWDGSGYPERLSKEDIPIGARIIKLSDYYDAIASPRPYREWTMSTEEAAKHMLENKNLFDPKIMKTFFEVLSEKI